MAVTPAGSVISVSPLQPLKADPPILVTCLPSISPGISSLVSLPTYPIISIVSSSKILYSKSDFVLSSLKCLLAFIKAVFPFEVISILFHCSSVPE